MAAKITFTQAEEAALYYAIKSLPVLRDSGSTKDNLTKLLKKMEAARVKKSEAFHGAAVATVLGLARDKFGDRFKTPSMITPQWIIKMQKAINDSGVDDATANKAIAACDWQGDIFASTLIYKLAELAVVAPRQGGLFKKPAGPPAPSKKSGWIGKLDED